MNVIVESINFDIEELAYFDDEGYEIVYGGKVIVSYAAQTSKVNKLQGEIVFAKDEYDDMTLSDVEQAIKKEL